jgi:hypothetical protein
MGDGRLQFALMSLLDDRDTHDGSGLRVRIVGSIDGMCKRPVMPPSNDCG